MSSKQTEKSNQGDKQIPNDWSPSSARVKRKSSKSLSEEQEAEIRKMFEEDLMGGNTPKPDVRNDNESSIATNDTIPQEDSNDTPDSLQTKSAESTEDTRSTQNRRVSGKQRKELLEEYRQTFLTIPKLDDRKPVFISCEVRDRIDGIVRRLGGRGGSVSGFIENLARHHLDIYEEDIEAWRKL
ncbi:MAG: DUF3408 domain-containing protein [Tannerella sp.]|jgi:hypothetical protein|nr:DUF3408 domain-containing protein [Tannerella sp.]